MTGGRDEPPRAPGESVAAAVATAYRQEWGRVVAGLIQRTGDWDLAEECAQEAFTRAVTSWERDGAPDRPGAWLTTVARNIAMDRLRRSARQADKLKEVAALAPDASDGGAGGAGNHDLAAARQSGVPDERLRLIFTCCHPALPMEARVALTLRTLGGLSTAEIARAFLVAEATMAKRLVRAKQKIANARIPYRVPPARELPSRTTGVLAVLYLLFNEGYLASAGAELVRKNLCAEAIALGRLLSELMPGDPEIKGLMALMLLQRSRQEARLDGHGDIVTLEDQDRSLWNGDDIDEAGRWLQDAAAVGPAGPYLLQAAIASHHSRSAAAAETNWCAMVKLYDRLLELTGSPVVELNRAVGIAMCDGPAVGLALVDGLERSGRLTGYYPLATTRADLLRRLGRRDEAATAYRHALDLVGTEPERRYLRRRLAEVIG